MCNGHAAMTEARESSGIPKRTNTPDGACILHLTTKKAPCDRFLGSVEQILKFPKNTNCPVLQQALADPFVSFSWNFSIFPAKNT